MPINSEIINRVKVVIKRDANEDIVTMWLLTF